jgi:tRNA modification GTPase
MREGLEKIVPTEDTIIAVATPYGRSGLGVVRISGARVRAHAARLLKTTQQLIHRHAVRAKWIDENGDTVDDVIATFFEGPRSYTGEDVLEVSAHGNPIVLNRIVESAQHLGVRIARPGEFTLRAVLNRKIDLIQAEAVRDFIDAQTEAQARTALRQLGGSVSKALDPIKQRLVDVIAHMEAGIDFADDDVDPPNEDLIRKRIDGIAVDLKELQRTYPYGRLLSSGLRLALIGKPNVGKSSLFNRLVSADRAIVTDIPGTTRDVVTETASLDGIPLQFCDTAGLRHTIDPVERIGVARSLEALHDADVVIVVLDASSVLDDQDRLVLERASNTTAQVVVMNKCDLPQAIDRAAVGEKPIVHVSARTGEGIPQLHDALRSFIRDRSGEALSDCILTNARQNESVLTAIGALDDGIKALASRTPHEMVLLDLYRALGALNQLTGEVVTEDILGRIFSTFCVGK